MLGGAEEEADGEKRKVSAEVILTSRAQFCVIEQCV